MPAIRRAAFTFAPVNLTGNRQADKRGRQSCAVQWGAGRRETWSPCNQALVQGLIFRR